MGHDSASIARTFYDAWNERDFDRGANLMADDGEIVIVGSGQHLRGQDGARQFSTMWATAFPDGRVTVDNVVAEGDRVAVEYTGRGTQTGPLDGPAGTVPATGRSVTLQLCDVWELREGKAQTLRTYFDTASLLTQLGVMPAATAAATA